MQQEVRDWQNHPITRNWIKASEEIIEGIEEELKERNIQQDPLRRAYLIGLVEGLEALNSYEPEIDEKTGEVIDI